MLLVSLITVVALIGVAIGVFLPHPKFSTSNLAAAGGGLLCGIALFWLMPEIAETWNWILAILITLAAALVVTVLDRLLHTAGAPKRGGVVAPLLVAAAIHSFLDGWAVRAVSDQPLASVAVPAGLAMHKFPEGLALGWVARRLNYSQWSTLGVCAAVELLTLVGGLAEPRADRAGTAAFGAAWTGAILAIIAGSFLYLGGHTLMTTRRRGSAGAVFTGTLIGVAIAAYVQKRMA